MSLTVDQFQETIEKTYLEKDSRRGLGGTFMWFVEEVGELGSALREGGPDELAHEFADVFAWLTTLASLSGIKLSDAAGRYMDGCPRCHKIPCGCAEKS